MKEKIAAVSFLVLALASRVSAQYATATIAECPNDGKGGVCVVFSGPTVKPTEAADGRFFPRVPADLTLATTARKVELNGLDTTKKVFAIGTVVADAGTTPPVEPPAPTADQLAVTAFERLLRTWGAVQTKVTLKMASSADVDAAAAAIAAAYTAAPKTVQPALDDLLWAFGTRRGPF